jgi:hypothetical protein
MHITVRGALSPDEREHIQNFHNGCAICDVIDQMIYEGITSTITVLGFMESQSIVVNQYESHIIEDGNIIRLSASDARAIVSHMKALRV